MPFDPDDPPEKVRSLSKSKQRQETLADLPALLSEACLEKNDGVDIGMIRIGSAKKIWWKCSEGHEWKAQVRHRVSEKMGGRGCGCPCCKRKSSSLELLCFSALKERWKDAVWQDKRYGVEVDVLLPELKVAIEVDGSYWHCHRENKDVEKNRILESNGYFVVRLRESPLGMIGSMDIRHRVNDNKKEIVERLICLIEQKVELISKNFNWESIFARYEDARRVLVPLDRSLVVRFPEVAKEFHPQKNGQLTPRGLFYGSKRKIWWQCADGHEWKAMVCNRTAHAGTGCPFCNGSRAHVNRCLLYASPGLCDEWSDKNDFSPLEVTPCSNRMARWVCGCGAEYDMRISDRVRGQRCPVCRYHRMAETRKRNNIARSLCRIAA